MARRIHMNATVAFPHALVFLAALSLAGLASGCGGPDDDSSHGPSGWSLLQRSPDHKMFQPGVLTPDNADQWGSLGLVGWDSRTRFRDGAHYVWSRIATGHLIVPAGPRVDRELEIDCWTPPLEEGETETMVVSLNGVEIGRSAIDSTPGRYSFETPAVLWQEGDNTLELGVSKTRMPSEGLEVRIAGSGQTAAAGIALARVAYGEPSAPTVGPGAGRLVLSPGTAVTYDLHAIVPIDLLVRAEPTGPGNLQLLFEQIDPDTGGVLAARKGYDVALKTKGIDRRFPVQAEPGDLLRLTARWDSPSGASLRFDRLDVFDLEKVERFPIVLISIDTLSAQHLSSYGYGRDTTPNIDALAADGVLFEHCVTNAPWTLPSFLSLMSGMYAGANRIPRSALPDDFGSSPMELWEMWALSDNRWTLAEALRGMGWQTGGFVDSYWLSERYQFTQGFEAFDNSASRNEKTDPEGGIRMVSRLALEWLDGERAEDGESAPNVLERGPFFLFAHCFDVHGPYSADEAFYGRFDGDEFYETEHVRFAGAVGSSFNAIHEYITANMYAPDATPREVPTGPIVASYDEGIALADDEVGKLLDELKDRGVYDDAMILLTADHGETMERGHTPFSHSVMDESVTHVPLIVKLPRGENAGRRVKQTVQLIDVYPTILDRIGLPLRRETLHGRSLVPLLNGGTLPDVPTFSEGGIVLQAAVHEGDWKLIARLPAYESSDAALITYPKLPGSGWEITFPSCSRSR